MRNAMRILPFLVALVLIFMYQSKLVTDANVLPFNDNWGRETQVGVTTEDDPMQVSGDDTVVWIADDKLEFHELTADGTLQEKAVKPLPVDSGDFLSYGQYDITEQKVTWLGRGGTLKQSEATEGGWSEPKVLAEGLSHFQRLALADGGEYFLTATEHQASLSRLHGGRLEPVADLNVPSVRRGALHLNAEGELEVALSASPAMGMMELHYATVDLQHKKILLQELILKKVVDYAQSIGDFAFLQDGGLRHLMYTLQSTRNGDRAVFVYDYRHGETPGNYRKLEVPTYFGNTPNVVASPVVDRHYQEGLRFLVSARYAKDPRHIAGQLVMVYMKNGEVTKFEPLTNVKTFVYRPAFLHNGEDTSVAFLEPRTFDRYNVLLTSNDPAYIAETNVITDADYKRGAMEVPLYWGVAFIYLFVALLWAFVPLTVIGYIGWRHEEFYEKHSRKLFWLGVLLYAATKAHFLHRDFYLVSQEFMPLWMQGGIGAELLVQAAMLAVSLLVTQLFRLTLPEKRSAGYELLYLILFDMTVSLFWYAPFSATV